jgi:hypothetical protein
MSTTQTNGTGVMTDPNTEANGLLALAQKVTQYTQAITDYLVANKYPHPTFAPDSIDRPETIEYAKLYGDLNRTLEDLQYLAGGPRRHFRALCCQGYELAAIQVALDFDFFSIVPAQGQISLEDLAKTAGVDLDRTSRIIRLLVTESLFREPTHGCIAHSPSSYLLHVDDEIRSTLHYTYVTVTSMELMVRTLTTAHSVDEMLKAASSTADNVKASPLEYDSALTPFTTRHGYPIFKFYEKDPKRSTRFAKAMAGWAKRNVPSPSRVKLEGFVASSELES